LERVSVLNLSGNVCPKEVFWLRSLLAGALLLSSLFEFSGRDVFQETTGKFIGKDPWQQNFRQESLARKFKFTPSRKTWFSSSFAIWKLFKEIVLKGILASCFCYHISCVPASWLQEISFGKKWCCVIFLQRDGASKPCCTESSLQTRLFITDLLFQDPLC
jgi:hypothetical protein